MFHFPRTTWLRSVLIGMTLLSGWGVVATRATHAAGVTLRVSGNRLVDATNNPVALHGVNRSGTEYECQNGQGFSDGPVDLASVQAMKSWQLNAVRVSLNEDCWLNINNPLLGGSAYQQAVINWVNLLTQQGMAVILELHQSAPGTLAATSPEPMADQDHSPAFWSGVAGTFKGYGNVLFDLYNEPDPIPYDGNYPGGFQAWQNADFACVRDGCTATARQGGTYQTAGMQQLVNTVRATGAPNVLLIAGIQDAETIAQYLGTGDGPGSYLPYDPQGNLMVSWHMYAQDACGDLTCWNSTVAPVAVKYPVLATEFGDTNCTSNLTNTGLPWLDNQHIGYLGWNWNPAVPCEALITNYNGTPSQPYGQAYHDHLIAIGPATATGTPPSSMPSSTSIPATSTVRAATTPATSTSTVVAAPSSTRTPVVPTATATGMPSSTNTPAVSGPKGWLGGSVSATSGAVGLTGEGTQDWAHWGLSSASSFDHKSAGNNQISNFSRLGSGAPVQYSGASTFSWTDGTPDGAVGGTSTGISVAGIGNGFQISAPADTTARTLRLYIGVHSGQAGLTATMSDGTSASYMGSELSAGSGLSTLVYTVKYAAGASGEALTLKYSLLSDYGGGSVVLEAATLAP